MLKCTIQELHQGAPADAGACPGWRREAEKECDLLEKKLQRTEAARAAEIASLSEQLQGLRDASAQQLSAKDAKVTDLIEELGNTQALLSEKEAALAEVRCCCTSRAASGV